ncbi:methyltransferase domain-containing protein [Christiangramia salexigens]|uniref:Methyltransferase n=1 Tax=Christiangramia salexigens TaxID=1913577 RepID=A0A1L3J344_9FLAO|nr:methyltransferase domain-containing protein [Christiangramia salexigens]APG59551.1 methyltransferase [Christiangramia salexigens]
MLNIDTSKRSRDSEIMDDFHLQGIELRKTLRDLDRINSWLGGNKVTITGIEKLLPAPAQSGIIRIADLGCGNGAILREVARWGRKRGYNFKLTGIDANTHAIEIGRELSTAYPEIEFIDENIFSPQFKKKEFDIYLCTLTLHHFKDDEIIDLMDQLHSQSKLGIVVNDLHRSKLAYVLFKAFCAVFVNNEIARKDGLTSILRGFKKEDFNEYLKNMKAKKQELSWKWAFRYQWIVKKEDQKI